MGWSDAARKAAAEARKLHAKGVHPQYGGVTRKVYAEHAVTQAKKATKGVFGKSASSDDTFTRINDNIHAGKYSVKQAVAQADKRGEVVNHVLIRDSTEGPVWGKVTRRDNNGMPTHAMFDGKEKAVNESMIRAIR